MLLRRCLVRSCCVAIVATFAIVAGVGVSWIDFRSLSATERRDEAESTPPPPLRVGVLTYAAWNLKNRSLHETIVSQIQPISWSTKLQYCIRHGYQCILEGEHLKEELNDTRHAAYLKVPAILKWLPRFDWLMWIDTDAMIMNASVTVNHVIDLANNIGQASTRFDCEREKGPRSIDLILSHDWNAPNFGVFLARNTPWMIDFLQRIDKGIAPCPFPEGWWENRFVICLLNANFSSRSVEDNEHVGYVPQRTLNSYGPPTSARNTTCQYHHGDFVIHFPGNGLNAELPATMRRFYADSAQMNNFTMNPY